MAEDHGGGEGVGADGAVGPVVYLEREKIMLGKGRLLEARVRFGGQKRASSYIAPADARIFHLHQDIIGGFELRHRPVLEPDFIDTFEDEGEVLLRSRRTLTRVSGGVLLVLRGQGYGRGGGVVRYLFNLCGLGGG